MHKLILFISTLFLLIAIPLLAQDEQGQQMKPPPPLNDAFSKWMIGEWKGTTTSPMGPSTDYMKCEMDLGGQFIIMTYKAEMADKKVYSGTALLTLDKDGKPVGYWFDSMRTISEGHGSQMGNISTMTWAMSPMPSYVRTTEKIDENTMRVTGVMTGPDGKEMKDVTEFKRIKK